MMGDQRVIIARLCLGCCFLVLLMTSYPIGTDALAAAPTDLYGIPNSGWKSPQWNWGSASGTGHDCAMICRNKYDSVSSRKKLVNNLLEATCAEPFEEVKLVLGLTWQRGRWNGRDGGKGGYGDVLALMAEAKRYEDGSAEDCAKLFVHDMQERYHLVAKDNEEDLQRMESLIQESDIFVARQRCSGLVLQAIGFVETGC